MTFQPIDPATMKRNKRRLPIPQHEFDFTPDTFGLILENGIDGERIARERDDADRARRLAEATQTAFFTTTTTQNHHE